MKQFAALYRTIDETTKTNRKLQAMRDHFRSASPEDAAWALFFLSGERFKRAVPAKALREWAIASSGLSSWLFEESYNWVGDLAETIALTVPSPATITQGTLAEWVEERIEPLRKVPVDRVTEVLQSYWSLLGPDERFVFLKLITGGLRVGVSKRLVVRAVADAFGTANEWVAHRLTGTWQPTREAFESLKEPNNLQQLPSQPYPFCLAHAIEASVPVWVSVASFKLNGSGMVFDRS